MNNKKYPIWSNYDLDYDDWRAHLEENYPELSESERIEMMYDINNGYLEDERVNLDIQLNMPILVIADLGLWDGRHSAYTEIASGNIKDCLFSNADYSSWYVDELGDLRCDASHHDGTNHYLYRVYKDGVSEEQMYSLKDKIYRGVATRADITRITRRLGDEIGKVYGWDFPKRGRTPKKNLKEAV